MEQGAVRESSSPYNSYLPLVPKKYGTWRMVIDYCSLDSDTIPDRMPIPIFNEIKSYLNGDRVFLAFYLSSRYWQVPLPEESIEYTTFSTHIQH